MTCHYVCFAESHLADELGLNTGACFRGVSESESGDVADAWGETPESNCCDAFAATLSGLVVSDGESSFREIDSRASSSSATLC